MTSGNLTFRKRSSTSNIVGLFFSSYQHITIKSNMKKILLWALFLLIGNACYAEDITIKYNGSKAKVTTNVKDSVSENFTIVR